MHHKLPCIGGTKSIWPAPNEDKSKGRWQITMNGRSTGVVNFRVKAINSTEWELIQGKSNIDPTNELTLVVVGMIQELEVDDTGNTGDFVLLITSMGVSQ